MELSAKDIMTADPVTIGTGDFLKDALKLMKNNRLSHLIVRNEEGLPAGIVAKSDILKHLLEVLGRTTGRTYTYLELNNIPVSSIMSSEPIHVSPDEKLNTIAALLVKNKINALPVVDKKQIIGIITAYDILKFEFDFK